MSDTARASLQREGLQPTPSGLWLDPGLDVGALEHHGHVVVGVVDVTWRTPVPPPAYTLVDLVHLPEPADDTALAAALDRARTCGRARRRVCRHCGRAVNPGLMLSLDTCMSCVEWRGRPRR